MARQQCFLVVGCFVDESRFLQHPLSSKFPGLFALEQGDLTNDIRANGQRHPIIILDGMVLDGWHRYQACLTLGIEPVSVPLPDGIDPVAYVQSVNLHRRHLSGSQRAAAVVACSEWAKPGQNQHGGWTPGIHPATTADMAKAAEVHPNTIKAAKRAQSAGLGDAVRDGKMTAKQAAEIAKLPEPERQAAIETPAPPIAKKRAPKQASASILPGPAAEIQGLKATIAAQEEEICELAKELEEALEENRSLERIANADSRLTSMLAENKQCRALVRGMESQKKGLEVKVFQMTRTAESWMRKFQRLEKASKETPGPIMEEEPEIEPEPDEPEDSSLFGEVG